MKNNNLVGNPLFKIIGIGFILYYALFANKHDNRSLSRRYSVDNIKESVGKAVQQKKQIEHKISQAKKEQATINKTAITNEKE